MGLGVSVQFSTHLDHAGSFVSVISPQYFLTLGASTRTYFVSNQTERNGFAVKFEVSRASVMLARYYTPPFRLLLGLNVRLET
jgi:hypothetical protein